jgi:hypothetical protein
MPECLFPVLYFPPGIYIWRNIPVTSGKEYGPTVDKTGAEYFNGAVKTKKEI